jgi:hypothetical protein
MYVYIPLIDIYLLQLFIQILVLGFSRLKFSAFG